MKNIDIRLGVNCSRRCMILVACLFTISMFAVRMPPAESQPEKNVYQEYLDYFETVYQKMQENYYRPVHRKDYNRFIDKFKNDIYAKLPDKTMRDDYITWRSSAYLIDYLKDPEDTFSAFYPPQVAKEFEQDVLGKKVDLGIEGHRVDAGYAVDFIEPRSDAFEKGLQENDIITAIDSVQVANISDEEIVKLLTPQIDSKTSIHYLPQGKKPAKRLELLAKEYFKQTVFLVPVNIPGVLCLEVRSFNRKTSEDMFRFLEMGRQHSMQALILDFRNNPGGPPLAAQEISSFFLDPATVFAYFRTRGEVRAELVVPEIPTQYRYAGPLAILVNNESGSAAELFSGIMQKRDRAVLIGENTAGQVFLKSMFSLDDESMLLLVTARGHYFDGSVFDFSGLLPDFRIQSGTVDLIDFAAGYLLRTLRAPGGK